MHAKPPVISHNKTQRRRQGAWGGQLSVPASAAATEDTPTQIALASLISSQLLSLPVASAAPADDRDSVTSTSTLAALRMTPAVAGAGVPASTAGEYAVPCERRQEVRSNPVSVFTTSAHLSNTRALGLAAPTRACLSSIHLRLSEQHHDVRRQQSLHCLRRTGGTSCS